MARRPAPAAPNVDGVGSRVVIWPDQVAIRARLTAELERIIAVLSGRDDVEQVWSIGSTSGEGRLHGTSDIDLVVVQRTDLDSVDRAMALRSELGARHALDIFVYTPEEFDSGGRFVTDVRRRGRRLR